MYTLAWGLAHRQLQQDSWSRTDRSLWEGRAHTFSLVDFLFMVTRVSLDADGAVCWSHGCLGNSRWKPFHGTNRLRKKSGWTKKASSGGEDEHILVWDPWSVTQENKETIPAPPGVADVTWSGFLPAETCLDVKFKKQKQKDWFLFTSYFLLSQQVMLWF